MTDKRLLCVASLVRENALLADVGTDHAYLPTYLLQNGRIRRAVAADIGEGPAASARRTVEAAGLTDSIDVRVCDGLSGISPGEVTDIVVAGMGGETIIHILSEAPWLRNRDYRLILQPMTKTAELRRFLFQNGFSIEEERVVRDGDRYYNVMAAAFADAVSSDDVLAPYVGALEVNEETKPYFIKQIANLRKKFEGLQMANKIDEATALLPVLKGLSDRIKPVDCVTVGDVADAMESIAPAALAEEWDNVGLLFGDREATVDTVVLALDVTPDALRFAIDNGAQMIVTHHPVLFRPVDRIVAPSMLYQLVTSGIAAFAAHTNLDAAAGGVNDRLAETLGLVDVKEAFGGIGRVGTFKEPMTPTAFAELVKNKLGTAVQLHEGSRAVSTVAMVGGAGGEYAFETEADAFLTGEMKHHEWIALPDTLTVAVAGHYATENVVLSSLYDRLVKVFPTMKLLRFDGCAPYRTV